MENAVILYTKRKWNPVSWLIRWALPISRFKWATASHSMILDGDHVIHATMLHGVVRQPIDEAMKGQTLVERKEIVVPNAKTGQAWAKSQIGKKYDWKGAFGISLTPDRVWHEDDSWFCHELCAAFLRHAGLNIFKDTGFITDYVVRMLR